VNSSCHRYSFSFSLTILFGGLACLVLAACKGPEVTITSDKIDIWCAPQTLRSGEWATLTILQISAGKAQKVVNLKPDAFLNEAHFLRTSQSVGTTPDGRWTYRVQVFLVRPRGATGEVVIDRNVFENLPATTPFFTTTIRSVTNEFDGAVKQ